MRRRSVLSSSPSSRRAWIEILVYIGPTIPGVVALLAEGVDRNSSCINLRHRRAAVALLAEGVDRNNISLKFSAEDRDVALLAEGVDRNCAKQYRQPCEQVALLAEGVDRNTATLAANPYVLASPSSRRAWIEMLSTLPNSSGLNGRPPRGGRG